MEECKLRARDHGLQFNDETLEYIVSNRDMLELSPKLMIPTLYDYWVHDVEVLKGIGRYKLYPYNPYETVINSRPAISFYNDNNPDWLNIMIFYHVLAHIDFFQNNQYFKHSWNDDFVGQALADKRMIAALRGEHGRWVDYAIEFSRGIDNLVGYFPLIAKDNNLLHSKPSNKLQFYFEVFLQDMLKKPKHEIFSEIERFNKYVAENPSAAESIFCAEIKLKYPEFQASSEKYFEKPQNNPTDILEFVRENSSFINKENNQWIKTIMTIVRNTSMYFQPQVRTKIINEGWASYWHDYLFRIDERIQGHETDYAKVNAGVTSINRIGLNPYAIGLRLIQYVEDLANKGKISIEFQKLNDREKRDAFNKDTGKGKEAIFALRKDFNDFTLIHNYVDQDFVDLHKLFVTGRSYDPNRQVFQYYIKSRSAGDYKNMLVNSLYHPPKINVDTFRTNENNLYLTHHFENKQLIKEFIPHTMIGLEYLWGNQVQLETTEIIMASLICWIIV
jgi:stage V sporulation protein R